MHASDVVKPMAGNLSAIKNFYASSVAESTDVFQELELLRAVVEGRRGYLIAAACREIGGELGGDSYANRLLY